jgi:lysophospholipase L1-like esterase
MNKQTSRGIIYLLAGSVLINIIGFSYMVYKHFKNKEKPFDYTNITYSLDRNSIYDVLHVKPTDRVFLGDSHTQRFDLTELLQEDHLINRGIDKDVAAGVLNRLYNVVNGHPQKIFLMVGANDLIHQLSTQKYIGYVSKIIQIIQHESPVSKLYIQSVLPSAMYRADSVKLYNEALVKLSYSHGITFINLYPYFISNGNLSKQYDCGDGIHLNGRGYLLWSKLIKPYLHS